MVKKNTKTKDKKKTSVGRPRKLIDYIMVKNLAECACTVEEIASYLNISHDTLSRNAHFKEVYQEGLHKCRRSLRRIQYDAAMAGDRTMLVWLGKQLLGQKEKQETDMTLQGGEKPIKLIDVRQRIKDYEKIFKEIST